MQQMCGLIGQIPPDRFATQFARQDFQARFAMTKTLSPAFTGIVPRWFASSLCDALLNLMEDYRVNGGPHQMIYWQAEHVRRRVVALLARYNLEKKADARDCAGHPGPAAS
jgi:hypothetical protein